MRVARASGAETVSRDEVSTRGVVTALSDEVVTAANTTPR